MMRVRRGAVLTTAILLLAPLSVQAQDAPALPDPAVAAYDTLEPVGPPLDAAESEALSRALVFDPAQLSGTAAVRTLRRPGPPQPHGLDVVGRDNPDGSGTVIVKQLLPPEWDAKIGADLNVAAAPPDAYHPNQPILAGRYTGNSTGAAWASVGVIDKFATLDARLDAGNDQTQLGTTFEHSVPVGSRLSVTLRNRFAVNENFANPSSAPAGLPVTTVPPPPGVAPEAVWSNERAVKFNILPTGTTLSAGLASTNIDPVTHNSLSAEQRLYGPLQLATSLNDIGQATANKSVVARLKFNW